MLQRCGLLSPAALDLDINVDQRDRSRSHARNARSLPYRLRDDFSKLLLHFARQSADRTVIEPIRNPALLGLLQPFDGTLLLLKISGILDFSFDRLKLVPDFRRRVSFKKTRHQIPKNRRQLLDSISGHLSNAAKGCPKAEPRSSETNSCRGWPIRN